MSKMQRNTIIIIKLAMVLIALFLIVVAIADPSYTKYGGIVASLLLPWLPDVVGRVLKTGFSFRLELTYLMFLFVALFCGIDFDFYRTVPGYDKVIHVVSGGLSAVLGYYVLRYFKIRATSRGFLAVFLICFGMAVAVGWEFFEFGCDRLLGQHMQELTSPGVGDTMLDMLAATGGTVIGTVILCFVPEKRVRKK